jgi:hypothetical protein
MAGMARIVSGVLLILLGAWGALVAFVGPYFHYAYTPDKAWAYNSGRLWLSVVPGAAAVLGGVLIAVSARRLLAGNGVILAGLGGAWFAVGGILGPVWGGKWMNPGTPVGGTGMRATEQVGFFTGLGVAIVLVAAVALGCCLVAAVQPAGHARDITFLLLDVHAVLDQLHLDGTRPEITIAADAILRESGSPYTLPALISALDEMISQLNRSTRHAIADIRPPSRQDPDSL